MGGDIIRYVFRFLVFGLLDGFFFLMFLYWEFLLFSRANVTNIDTAISKINHKKCEIGFIFSLNFLITSILISKKMLIYMTF